jgi:hypothetical protein
MIAQYTSKSAHLCKPNNRPSALRISGKKVKTNNPIPIDKNTIKCNALNFCFFAISKEIRKIINQEIMKKISRSVMKKR